MAVYRVYRGMNSMVIAGNSRVIPVHIEVIPNPVCLSSWRGLALSTRGTPVAAESPHKGPVREAGSQDRQDPEYPPLPA